MDKIVLNIPHSSTYGIFDQHLGKWDRNPFFINDCVNRWTDWYTDMLFSTKQTNVENVVFNYSRFVCDIERLENDPKEIEGQGIIYSEFDGFKRGELDEIAKKTLLLIREKHLNEIISKLTENSLIIDCHSFPSGIYDKDINIGFNDDWSYDENVVKIISDEFIKNGYSVSLNKPYKNSITPKANFKYKSVMIEVNKKIYMNEKTLSLDYNSRQWMRWFGTMDNIYNKILKLN